MNRIAIIAPAIAVVAVAYVAYAGPSAGTARVIDGDTIELSGQRVRLYGIDAPENSQTCRRNGEEYACGRLATKALEQLVGGARVSCKGTGRDSYGRTIATCYVNGIDINEAMVLDGMAVAYARYSTQYLLAEETARKNRIGMWAGEFQMPWDYRRDNR